MNYGMVKRMYDVEDKFLYEILDDYKDAVSEKEKDNIINAFMKLIWSSKNKRSVTQKSLRFSVYKTLLETDIGKIFNMYSDIKYTSYRSMSKDTDFISLMRQKINNIYTNLCDSNVCLKKEYMDLIKLPKQMFYRWKSGEVYNPNTLIFQLDDILSKSAEVKEKYAKQKMSIEWNEYKTLIIPYFKRMFENYIPLEKFEDKNYLTIDIETWNEDNFAVAYLCKGLDGYMRNYQKKYYGVREHQKYKYCISCGKLIEDKSKTKPIKYCDECKVNYRLKKYKKYNEKRI
jgi:hypothetical protein